MFPETIKVSRTAGLEERAGERVGKVARGSF